MPTLAQMNFPTPESWDEFEELTLDALKIRWSTTNLFRHGRQGQPQNGVDIYGQNDLKQYIGVQCKKYDLKLNLKTINEEIEKAEKFKPCLEVLYFATTTPRDSKLQEKIRLISEERVKNNKFSVYIFFWKDIIQDLTSNMKIMRKYYPQLFGFNDQTSGSNLIGLFPLVYFGKNLRFYMNIIFVELMSNPLDMEYICDCVSNGCIFIKDDIIKSTLYKHMNELKNYLFNSSLVNIIDNIWERAGNSATSIENIIESIKGLLENDELLIYKICEILANWDRKVYKDIIIDKFSINNFLCLLDKLNLQKNIVDTITNLVSHELNNLEKINTNLPMYIYYLIQDAVIMKNIV